MSRLALYTGRPLRGPIRAVAGTPRTIQLALYDGTAAIDLTGDGTPLVVTFDMERVPGVRHLSRQMTVDNAASGWVSITLTDLELAEGGEYVCRVFVSQDLGGASGGGGTNNGSTVESLTPAVLYALPSGPLGILLSVAGDAPVDRSLLEEARGYGELAAGSARRAEDAAEEAAASADRAETAAASIPDTVAAGTHGVQYVGGNENTARQVGIRTSERIGFKKPLDFAEIDTEKATTEIGSTAQFDIFSFIEPDPALPPLVTADAVVGGSGSLTVKAQLVLGAWGYEVGVMTEAEYAARAGEADPFDGYRIEDAAAADLAGPGHVVVGLAAGTYVVAVRTVARFTASASVKPAYQQYVQRRGPWRVFAGDATVGTYYLPPVLDPVPVDPPYVAPTIGPMPNPVVSLVQVIGPMPNPVVSLYIGPMPNPGVALA